MKFITLLSAVLIAVVPGALSVAEWGQCGGTGFTGSTSCDSGLKCVYLNDWYSQCQKGTAAATTTTTTTRTTTANNGGATTTSSGGTTAVTGFVKTSGQKFTVNGVLPFISTNAYWLAQLGSSSLITQAFSEIAQAGTTVVRTWGFNDVTSPSGTYYQLFQGSTVTINTGSTGLGKFDTVVAAAKAAGIRLVVPLLYIQQLVGSGQPASTFYTNSACKNAYKNYVKTFVNRYINEPTIMAWQLTNEARCNGCATSVITSWATEMSAYIKSLDSNHLVSLGDEGFFNQPGSSSYPYQGGEGIDFTANLKISTIDYGTFHLYPIGWGVTSGYQAWGSTWITDHAAVQKSVGKPTIIEEYGVTTSDRATVYAAWWNSIVSSGLSGGELAATTASGSGYNDGYGISTSDSIFSALKAHTAAMKARS
ncbi:glycoside hydrolase family 5 protein [Serendipita vermifera MAFF 305830]|uniref:mannan endo-1,4-beta-mannosidase n=1 Tax=Serendipita vermifera MAFF 305830 TaxID=933852 RepID=A0A0C2WA64_SERVB|nr:glycoside hydrolase family 5 protein [Serendipita vermifera MAFF 305830]